MGKSRALPAYRSPSRPGTSAQSRFNPFNLAQLRRRRTSLSMFMDVSCEVFRSNNASRAAEHWANSDGCRVHAAIMTRTQHTPRDVVERVNDVSNRSSLITSCVKLDSARSTSQCLGRNERMTKDGGSNTDRQSFRPTGSKSFTASRSRRDHTCPPSRRQPARSLPYVLDMRPFVSSDFAMGARRKYM